MVARVSRLKINFRYNKLSDYVFLFTIIKRKLMQVESNTSHVCCLLPEFFYILWNGQLWHIVAYTLH